MKKFTLDEIDHQILDILIENARTPFTDIAKRLIISPGTVHVRVKKMEEEGIIEGATLILDYEKLGYTLVAHLGVLLERTSDCERVIESLKRISNVTVAYITSGKYNIFCKIRTKGVKDVKDIIFKINQIQGVIRTESMIALQESINDKKRIMRKIFREYSAKNG